MPEPRIALVIPALNEEQAIAQVLDGLPPGLFARVVVVDNGSTDATAAVARSHGAEVVSLLEPILRNDSDLVIGSRALGKAEPGSLTWPQRWGNRLSVALIHLLFGHRYTDLGPFRAIRRQSIEVLGMQDTNFGWTVEMQVKALQRGLRPQEVPVSYRRRLGQSKISGTVSGVVKAGSKIIWTILKLRFAAEP